MATIAIRPEAQITAPAVTPDGYRFLHRQIIDSQELIRIHLQPTSEGVDVGNVVVLEFSDEPDGHQDWTAWSNSAVEAAFTAMIGAVLQRRGLA